MLEFEIFTNRPKTIGFLSDYYWFCIGFVNVVWRIEQVNKYR